MRSRTVGGKTGEERLKARIDLLRQAISLDPQFAEANSSIAFTSYTQGVLGDLSAHPRGLEAAHQAIAINPELPGPYHAMGLNLQQMGRLQEALPAYRKAVELNPSGVSSINDFSMGLSTAGRCDEALAFATRSLVLSPNVGSTPYNVGLALLCLDDDARAERYLTAAAARFPNAHRIQVVLAFLDLKRGQTQAAVERIRAAVEKSPGNTELLIARAEIFTFAGTADAGDVVASLVPRAADALFHTSWYPVKLAHAYHLQQRGARAEAMKILDQILEANRQSIVGGADWPIVFAQNAAARALRGETAAALDELDRAYAAGWREGRMLAIDPLLASLREESGFTQLLARIEADVADMRARADYSGLPD